MVFKHGDKVRLVSSVRPNSEVYTVYSPILLTGDQFYIIHDSAGISLIVDADRLSPADGNMEL